MDTAETKLDNITRFWNHYVWNYKIIQKRILWNKEVKTNYYGDILAYFSDTFELIKPNKEKEGFKQNIIYATGLMQIIYVHQDLMDELLRIFKQPKSSRADKNPNRQVRNELVGHPISRKKGTLISSIFWGNELSEEIIHYIKYSRAGGFSGQPVYYLTEDIIESHRKFLNDQFDKIQLKINKILKYYLKKLGPLREAVNENRDFKNIVVLTSQIHEYFFERNYLYKEEYLLECKAREHEHKRYKYIVDNFLKELGESIDETKSDVYEIISKKRDIVQSHEDKDSPKVNFVFSVTENPDIDLSTDRNNYSYVMQKLYSRSPAIDIDCLKVEFSDDSLIIQELVNMKKNYTNDLEYYSSCYYLRYLLKQKKLI